MVSFELVVPREYAHVILVNVALAFILTWMGTNVSKARKKYNVSYPTMYAESSHPHATAFNCVQRAHQNSLEMYPYHAAMMFIGGFRYPIVSAVAGAVWGIGRIVYAKGYSTGDPAKRLQGSFGYIGTFALLFTNVAFALSLLGIIA